MVALLDDRALVHDEDRVGVADRREPVGDHERGAALHQPGHRALDQDLGARVDRRRRLVEDEDRRVGEERPRDRQELLLARGQVRRVVVDDRVVAVGQRPHEVVDVGGLGGGHDLLVGRGLAAVGDVLADRAVEQPRVLEDHAERAAQVVAGHLARVDAVDRDPPAVELVEAHQQVHERRLAGARRADDGDGLAGVGDEVEVVDERHVRQVAERDVLERDGTRESRAGAEARPGRRSPRARRGARRRARRRRRPTGGRSRSMPPGRSGT